MGRTASEPERLRRGVEQVLKATAYSDEDVQGLLKKVPKRWQRHGDLVILRRDAFDDCRWDHVRERLWEVICDALRCKRLALAGRIADDGHRTPQVELVRGHDGWVTHVDNKIKYTFDVTKCMFSAGNVTEKLRVSSMDCRGEIVVDLFAGIGYFTLPYLLHTGAAHVHACEWNPDALEALRSNLQLNGVQDRCTVHAGDCREVLVYPAYPPCTARHVRRISRACRVFLLTWRGRTLGQEERRANEHSVAKERAKRVCPEGVADRVNLGLIPSSAVGWQTACQALNPQRESCWMHVHENVESKPNAKGLGSEQLEERVHQVCTIMADLMKHCHPSNSWNVTCVHVEHVKSYAPRVEHVVMDLRFDKSVET